MKLTSQQLKVSLLVDTRANAILDLHVTTTRKHDTQIAPSLINRNAAKEGDFNSAGDSASLAYSRTCAQ